MAITGQPFLINNNRARYKILALLLFCQQATSDKQLVNF